MLCIMIEELMINVVVMIFIISWLVVWLIWLLNFFRVWVLILIWRCLLCVICSSWWILCGRLFIRFIVLSRLCLLCLSIVVGVQCCYIICFRYGCVVVVMLNCGLSWWFMFFRVRKVLIISVRLVGRVRVYWCRSCVILFSIRFMCRFFSGMLWYWLMKVLMFCCRWVLFMFMLLVQFSSMFMIGLGFWVISLCSSCVIWK